MITTSHGYLQLWNTIKSELWGNNDYNQEKSSDRVTLKVL